MGLFKTVRRRKWKRAVVVEFQNHHGINLQSVGDVIGPATLDDLLNDQYECAPRSPAVGARNVTRVLGESFGVNLNLLAMHAKIGALCRID